MQSERIVGTFTGPKCGAVGGGAVATDSPLTPSLVLVGGGEPKSAQGPTACLVIPLHQTSCWVLPGVQAVCGRPDGPIFPFYRPTLPKGRPTYVQGRPHQVALFPW